MPCFCIFVIVACAVIYALKMKSFFDMTKVCTCLALNTHMQIDF